MNASQLPDAHWFKSSRSAVGNCVEVAVLDQQVAVRDSKDPEGPALLFNNDERTAFVGDVARPMAEDRRSAIELCC